MKEEIELIYGGVYLRGQRIEDYYCEKCDNQIMYLNDLELEELKKEGSFVCSDCINKEMGDDKKMNECEHVWDYTEEEHKGIYFESESGSTMGYLDVVCAECGAKGREVYTFEGTEEIK
ncbi:hypothetical protein LCGC14_2672590 [marine sediment metagenome]|uniref:Uncharacterized protein n=1 Tax=marine sediment metagenome TaxID=412755 RepID=A0A0F9AB55_9ZZZZ